MDTVSVNKDELQDTIIVDKDKLSDTIMDWYKRGYREGFDDSKAVTVDLLNIIDTQNDPAMVKLIEAIKAMNYE